MQSGLGILCSSTYTTVPLSLLVENKGPDQLAQMQGPFSCTAHHLDILHIKSFQSLSDTKQTNDFLCTSVCLVGVQATVKLITSLVC